MSYLDLYLFAVHKPNTMVGESGVLARWKPNLHVPCQEVLSWKNKEGVCDIHREPMDPDLWASRRTSQHVHVSIEERVGLVWVGNYIAPARAIRIRDPKAREVFLKGLEAFANPNQYTVEIEP